MLGRPICSIFYSAGAPGSFVIGLFYFLVRGLKRLRGKKVSVSPIPMGFRILAFCVLVLSCCALFFLRFHTHSEGLPGTTGGALGSAIGSELLYWMSLEAATVFVLVLVLFCSSVFFGFSWMSVAEQIGRTFERLFRRVASIKQSKEDDAFAKASMEEERSRFRTDKGLLPNCLRFLLLPLRMFSRGLKRLKLRNFYSLMIRKTR